MSRYNGSCHRAISFSLQNACQSAPENESSTYDSPNEISSATAKIPSCRNKLFDNKRSNHSFG